jgi:hypothetical protein
VADILTARCGDLVYRLPNGDVRRVAFLDLRLGVLAMNGPDDSLVPVAECKLVFQWGDYEHWLSVKQWHDRTEPDRRREHVLRLYGAVLENPPPDPKWVDDGRKREQGS